MTQQYPADSSNEDNGGKSLAFSAICLLLVNAVVLVVLGHSIIGFAKLLLVEVMLAISIFCVWIFLHRRQYFEELYRQEVLAERARDDAMFELTAVRTRLAAVEDRLTRSSRPNPGRINKMLVQYAGSAVMMLLQKERSYVQWGLWAAKFGKTVFDYFRDRSNH